jgi:mitochondrial fission protein ELM1
MLNILVITDYKLSSLNQCNSIINELKKNLKKKIIIKYMKVELGLIGYLPNILIYFFLRIRYLFKSPQKIDFIISCGRISAPFNLVFKKINSAKNCHILNPYFRKSEFDKIIIPKHDIKKKIDENVITTFGTLVDLTKFKKESRKVYKYLDKKKKKYHFLLEEMVKVLKLCSTNLIIQLKN